MVVTFLEGEVQSCVGVRLTEIGVPFNLKRQYEEKTLELRRRLWKEQDLEQDEEEMDPNSLFQEKVLGAVSNLSAVGGEIKIALWILAGVLFLSLFI